MYKSPLKHLLMMMRTLILLPIFQQIWCLDKILFLGTSFECLYPVESDLYLEIHLTQANDDAPLCAYGSLYLPEGIEGSDIFVLKIHKRLLDSGDWENNIREIDGDVCTAIKEYFDAGWTTLRPLMNPKFEKSYSILKGNYTFKEICISEGSFIVPPGMLGEYRADIYVYKDDVPYFCIQVHVKVVA